MRQNCGKAKKCIIFHILDKIKKRAAKYGRSEKNYMDKNTKKCREMHIYFGINHC